MKEGRIVEAGDPAECAAAAGRPVGRISAARICRCACSIFAPSARSARPVAGGGTLPLQVPGAGARANPRRTADAARPRRL